MSLSPALPFRPHARGYRRRVVAAVVLLLLGAALWLGLRLRHDAEQVAQIRLITGSQDSAADLVFAPSGRLLFGSDWGGVIRAWQMPSGAVFTQFGARGQAVNTLAVSRDGAQLAAGDDRGLVQRWEIGSGRVLPALNVGVPVRQVAFSPDGEELAVAAHGTTEVLRFDTRTGMALAPIPVSSEASALAYTANGRYLIIADERAVRVWDRRAKRRARTLPEERVSNLAVSPDSTRVVLSGLYRTACVYEIVSGERVCQLPVTQPGSIAFFADSRRFLLGYGSDVSVCDSENGQVGPSLTPPLLLGYTPTFLMRIFPYLRRYQRLPIQKVVLSPDGHFAAFAIQDTVLLLPLDDAALNR